MTKTIKQLVTQTQRLILLFSASPPLQTTNYWLLCQKRLNDVFLVFKAEREPNVKLRLNLNLVLIGLGVRKGFANGRKIAILGRFDLLCWLIFMILLNTVLHRNDGHPLLLSTFPA